MKHFKPAPLRCREALQHSTFWFNLNSPLHRVVPFGQKKKPLAKMIVSMRNISGGTYIIVTFISHESFGFCFVVAVVLLFFFLLIEDCMSVPV